MINAQHEMLLTPSEVAKLPLFRSGRTGRPVHKATVWRWFTRGALSSDGRRVFLERIRLPGGSYSSSEAVDRFIAALNPDQVHRTNMIPPVPVTKTAVAAMNATAAGKFLDAVGICDKKDTVKASKTFSKA